MTAPWGSQIAWHILCVNVALTWRPWQRNGLTRRRRAGLRAAVPGSELAAGDYVVRPVFPDPDGFYRPYPGSKPFDPPADATEFVAEFVWEDRLAAQTVPNFYGGTLPVTGRDHPRLRVRVLRMTAAWRVPP